MVRIYRSITATTFMLRAHAVCTLFKLQRQRFSSFRVGALTINFVLQIGGGCGGCSFVCCSPSQACKAPRNTHTEDMHWLDKKNAVHSVKKGELIPHYSKIVQVHMDGKWQTFTPASDMKAAQDACSCVQAVRFFFFSLLPLDYISLCCFNFTFHPVYPTLFCLPLRAEYLLRPRFSWFMIVEKCKAS